MEGWSESEELWTEVRRTEGLGLLVFPKKRNGRRKAKN